MMKSHGRDLSELIGEDDEDHDTASAAEAAQRADDEMLHMHSRDSEEPDSLGHAIGDDGEDVDGGEYDGADDLDTDAVENHAVWLPSHFDAAVLEQIPALKRMVERERQLRRVHCDRRKRDLNLSLRVFGVMIRDTKKLGLTTRARATIERQKQTQKRLVKSYQVHQQALERLGSTDEDRILYPDLTWEQLLRHRPTRPDQPREIGTGKSKVRGPGLPWLTMDVSHFDLANDEETTKDLICALSTDGECGIWADWRMLTGYEMRGCGTFELRLKPCAGVNSCRWSARNLVGLSGISRSSPKSGRSLLRELSLNPNSRE